MSVSKRAGGARVLWVDGTAGASGDMILGALVDLGVPLTRIRGAIDSLPMDGWRMSTRKVVRRGIAARKVNVRITGKPGARGWREIRRVVNGGDLSAGVRRRALEIFRRLIEAEAEVHGLPADRVHLHEAGAIDAIVDVVGACVGLDYLAPDRILVSPLTTGYGTVRCQHGVLPVPAPATALLIRGAPVRGGEVETECLTPTGAAILTSVADGYGSLPAMKPEAVGHGAGDRELEGRPNVLRMILGRADEETAQVAAADRGRTLAIEFTVDDAPPQVLAYAVERLFAAGALEVFTAPVQMKKGRSGHNLTVLARPDRLNELAAVAFRETTTFGLRYRLESRIELERSHTRVNTSYGAVRVKTGRLDGTQVQAWPEFEDCATLARRNGVPLKEIQQAALEAYRVSKATKGRRRKESK
jgi:uncharacterized protein (TIGR00299 family) protein